MERKRILEMCSMICKTLSWPGPNEKNQFCHKDAVC